MVDWTHVIIPMLETNKGRWCKQRNKLLSTRISYRRGQIKLGMRSKQSYCQHKHAHSKATRTYLVSWFQDPYGDEIPVRCTDPSTRSTLSNQLDLGWFATLAGFLHPDMIETQHRYYLVLRRRKTGRKWATHLIKHFWNIIHSLWVHRCSVLHDSDAIHRLNGLSLLRDAVEAEYNRGLGDMPQSYRSYFYTPLFTILKKSPSYIKGWFLVIRSGRECYHLENTEDSFFTNTTLRAWIGLAPLE